MSTTPRLPSNTQTNPTRSESTASPKIILAPPGRCNVRSLRSAQIHHPKDSSGIPKMINWMTAMSYQKFYTSLITCPTGRLLLFDLVVLVDVVGEDKLEVIETQIGGETFVAEDVGDELGLLMLEDPDLFLDGVTGE